MKMRVTENDHSYSLSSMTNDVYFEVLFIFLKRCPNITTFHAIKSFLSTKPRTKLFFDKITPLLANLMKRKFSIFG